MNLHKMLGALALTATATLLPVATALAQAWPAKPVTLVVPFPPGGASDSVARTLGNHLQERLKQTFVVENKAGATGTIGAAQVKRAPADGSTFLVTSLGPLVIAPHLLKNVPYDAGKDFDYITVAVQAPNVLVVPAASPHKTLADVLAHLKAQPEKMTFASSGNGSSDHLTAELFWLQTGTTGVHVPYKGGGPAISDLLGGQVDAGFMNINSVIQHINAGKLKVLAITSEKRSPLLPQVPTLGESGVKGADVQSWQAVVAPKGLPADVRNKMHEALVAALNDPKIRAQFTGVGLEIVANTPEQFVAFQQRENARWKQLIEARKITAD
ncbi:MAG: Bug family tripartite tricarboxylate transporter substrate binding protein [Rubrivivax sp.]